ncbi:hypothetical protein IJH89_01130 [Candidatus Saccharibacteria bacterium]|nr:hypothetical protein [Candidatus Saccharibacteria bacterium]
MSKKLIVGASVVASFAVALAPLATFAVDTPSDQHTDELVLTVLPSCTFGSASKGTTPYPGGITHDDGTSGYAADADTGKTATAWNTAATTAEAGPTPHAVGTGEGFSAGEVDHIAGDIASTGYGTLVGESGTTAGNSNASAHTVHRSMLAGTTTDTFASTTMWVVCNNRGGYSVTATAAPLTNETAAENITVNSSFSAAASGYDLKAITSTSAGTAMTIPTAADVTPTNETIIATHATVSDEAGDSLTVVYGLGVAASQKADTYAGTVTYKLYKGVNGAGA